MAAAIRCTVTHRGSHLGSGWATLVTKPGRPSHLHVEFDLPVALPPDTLDPDATFTWALIDPAMESVHGLRVHLHVDAHGVGANEARAV